MIGDELKRRQRLSKSLMREKAEEERARQFNLDTEGSVNGNRKKLPEIRTGRSTYQVNTAIVSPKPSMLQISSRQTDNTFNLTSAPETRAAPVNPPPHT